MKNMIYLLVLSIVLTAFAGCGTQQPSTPITTQTTVTTQQTTVTVPETTQPPELDYADATVILYTANVRGNVQVYSAIAAARQSYEALGSTVIVVDAGNYLQGTAYANADMGLSIYKLMEAAGYDVAGMGVYDLVHGEAEVGYAAHGDLVKHYTQAQLYRGTKQLQYRQNGAWEREPVMATREEKGAAAFSVICSNMTQGENATGYYDFDTSVVLGNRVTVGFVSIMPQNAAEYLGDGFLYGYKYRGLVAPQCDILVSLGGGNGDIVIDAPTDGAMQVGAWVIDNRNGRITFETVDLSGRDAEVDRLIAEMEIPDVIGTSKHLFNGSTYANYNGQTDLGDLVADALKWYAETYMEGIAYPVIGLQSGSNCRNFLYSGEITQADLKNAIHASTAGIAVVYVTGAQLLEALEASTQQENCPGWAQVSGIDYTVDTSKIYDAGAMYGYYYEAGSIQRVSITTEGFALDATYAVIADRMLLNGSDTYYTFRDCPIEIYGEDGLDVCDVVALYVQQALGGNLD